MRRLVLGAMVALAPFTGIRVVCVESPAPEPARKVAEAEPLSDCERLCPLHRPADTSNASSDGGMPQDDTDTTTPDCAFSTDGFSIGLMTTWDLSNAMIVIDAPVGVAAAYPPIVGFYDEPALTLLGPPPKLTLL